MYKVFIDVGHSNTMNLVETCGHTFRDWRWSLGDYEIGRFTESDARKISAALRERGVSAYIRLLDEEE